MSLYISLLNNIAVSFFGGILSASFCNALSTRKRKLIFIGCMVLLPLIQSILYFSKGADFVRHIYPLAVHLPLVIVLWMLTGKLLWSVFSVQAAYLCCELRRWVALATVAVFSGRQMMQEVLEKKTDMVVGDRLSSTYFEENKRPFHNFGNSLVRFSINHLFKSDIRDIMTGYRAFSFQFVKTFPVLSKGFEIETEMSIHAVDKNMQISNIIIEYRDRPEGSESKLNTYSDGFKVLKTIGRLYKNYKPMNFFGILSLLLIIIAAILFVPIFVTYVQTGLVPRFPTLIASGFIVLAALQSFFSGMILDTFAQKNRQEFEAELNTMEMNYKDLLKKE